MYKATLSHRDPQQDKPLSLCLAELTDEEVFRLMRAFMRGKTTILEADEADALILMQWAQRMRMGACLLEMVLDGDLTPVVEAGVVKFGLPANAPQSRTIS